MPAKDDDGPQRRFVVVANDEEQYSLWPQGTPPPSGWRATGFVGGEDEALDHIAKVWTDIRPRSARSGIAEAQRDRS